MTGLRLAVAFLTVIPIGPRESPASLAHARAYFPLVGLALGGALLGLHEGLRLVTPPMLTGALLVVGLIAVTRGLHLDGFVDTCDGLAGGRTPERRLNILRDSRVGAFAVMGGVAVILLKWTAIVELPAVARVAALALFPMLGRWGMVLAMSRYSYARSEGMGTAFMRGRNHSQVVLAASVALVSSVLVAGAAGLLLLGVATLAAWAVARWMNGLFQGLTGDTYGAINETVEVVALVAIVVIGGVAPALVGWPLPWRVA